MSREAALVLSRRLASTRALKQALGLLLGQLGGVRLEHRVIGRRRAQLLEVRSTLGDRADEARVIARPKAVELGRRELEERVGPKRRDHSALPAGFADRAMVLERVGRSVRRRQHLDVEALEQRARPELWALELLDDLVVRLCSYFTQSQTPNPEYLKQLVVEPRPRRRAAEQVIVLGEELPHAARCALHQIFERHAIGVQQARDAPHRGIGIEEAVGVQTVGAQPGAYSRCQ